MSFKNLSSSHHIRSSTDFLLPLYPGYSQAIPTTAMTLSAVLTSLKKAQAKRSHSRGTDRPTRPLGSALQDQRRLTPAVLEKKHIGSMLLAFNTAEETQRAAGGPPCEVQYHLGEELVRRYFVALVAWPC